MKFLFVHEKIYKIFYNKNINYKYFVTRRIELLKELEIFKKIKYRLYIKS